ncbi:MAG TPA: hypothetical protein VIL48_08655 [Acidimicrobiales bacterium]
MVVLAAAATWALWPDRTDRPVVERAAFEAALADLAAAPALRYTASMGEVVVPYEATATGEVRAHAPDIPSLPGDITTDLLFVDNKLFVRMTGSLDPAELGLDPSDPVVREALENVQDREGGLGSGEWVTSISEYDGPILRDALSPVGLATRLTDLLVETPDDRLRPAPEQVAGTPALVAETPDGDLYVSASPPHRVLRFAAPAPPGSGDGGGAPGGDGPGGEPAPPSLPSIPAPPPIPDRGDRGGDGPGDDDHGPTPGGVPSLPEPPPIPDGSGRTAPGWEPGFAQQPPGTDGPGGTAPDRSGRAPQVPELPGGDAPLLQQLGGGAARVDLEVLTGDDARRVYDELAAATEELVDAEDGVLQYSDDEMALSLARALETGEALGRCDAESCEVRADATLVHGRGAEVPTAATFAMTVDGEPAGACTARGVIPVSGTGPLSCTNDSEEWAAAYRPGAEIGVELRTVEAMAFSPDDVETVTADIRAHADAAIEAYEGRPGRPGPRGLQAGGVVGRWPAGAAAHGAGAVPARIRTPDTPSLGDVLDELGIARSAWDELAERVGETPPGVGPSETVTAADVAVLEQTILEAAHAWHGGRLLDRIDPASARRVIERALAARTRSELHRAVAILNAAYHVIWTSELAPGRADSLARGARVFLAVAEDALADGAHRVDLSGLDLDAATGRIIDVAYVARAGGWHFETVVAGVREARTPAFAERVALLQDAVERGLGSAVVDVRQADGLDGLFTEGVPDPSLFGGTFQPTRPPSPDNRPEGPPVTVSEETDNAARRSRANNTPLGGEQEQEIRAVHRVNESAEVLAAAGYRVVRDQPGRTHRDLDIDDDFAIGDPPLVLEHKAPHGETSMSNLAHRDITGRQSRGDHRRHYVINLNDRTDPHRSLAELRDAVADRRPSRVESVIAVIGREAVPVYPTLGAPIDVVAGEPPPARRSGSGPGGSPAGAPAVRRPALGLRIPGTEFTGEQVRAIRDTVDEQRIERRRLPGRVREALRTPLTMRRVVEPGMNRRGVPFQPTVCTCPPCGATRAPGLGAG